MHETDLPEKAIKERFRTAFVRKELYGMKCKNLQVFFDISYDFGLLTIVLGTECNFFDIKCFDCQRSNTVAAAKRLFGRSLNSGMIRKYLQQFRHLGAG